MIIGMALSLMAMVAAGSDLLPDGETADPLRQYSSEHPALWPVVNRVRTAADGLDGGDPLVAMAEVKETHRLLVQVLLPYEAAEDTLLYPAVGRVLGGYDPTLPMSRTHAAIHHQVHLFGRLVVAIGAGEPTPEDLADLRPIMYGLHAVLALHFAQEEEGYFPLVDDEGSHGQAHCTRRILHRVNEPHGRTPRRSWLGLGPGLGAPIPEHVGRDTCP
ncbi:MAG TPA: hemerythrin domain-containing protein [Kineosporiaceae bacterium]|nr:hemerythrin domain-containing protein [Kineosporiaceae bacterium]